MQAKPIQMPIYMDYNATTPIDPRVTEAMQPYLGAMFGNASSASHAFGWQASAAVKKARGQVAELLGCRPIEVFFTSGATESNNLAILGLLRAMRGENPHFITQATEHKAVLEVMDAAQEWGASVTVLPVDADGLVSVAELERALRPNTRLVSIMLANNEVGTIQPIAEIAELCRARKIVLHCDAAQAACKFDFSLAKLPIDMISISGHKIYAPKGVGALVVRPVNRDFELKPIQFGGEQENRLRPGTLNVAGIVGLGLACELGRAEVVEECRRLSGWRDEIFAKVRAGFPRVRINGSLRERLCNNMSFSFPDVHADDLILHLSGIAYSSGSACNSSNPKPSHVLTAMGLEDGLARTTLRLGMGRFTTESEVHLVTDKLLKMLNKFYGAKGEGKASPL